MILDREGFNEIWIAPNPDYERGIGVYNKKYLSRQHLIDRNISKNCVYDLDERVCDIENYDMF